MGFFSRATAFVSNSSTCTIDEAFLCRNDGKCAVALQIRNNYYFFVRHFFFIVLVGTEALLCFFLFLRTGTGDVGGRGEVAYVRVSLRANLESCGLLLSAQTMEESEPTSFDFQPGSLTNRILTSCARKQWGWSQFFYKINILNNYDIYI